MKRYTISSNQGDGVNYYGYGDGKLSLSQNTLGGNRSFGIRIYYYGYENLTVTENSISNCGDDGISIYSEQNNQAAIESNTVAGCSGTGIVIYGRIVPSLRNNLVDNNQRGIVVSYSDVNGNGGFTISGNAITNNREYGIDIEGYARPVIHLNDIYGNGGYAIRNNTTFGIDAKNNWWGDAVTQEMNAGNNPQNLSVFYDSLDDNGKGFINYADWASGSNITPPPPPETTITSQPANISNISEGSFSFISDKTGSTFQCQLDSGEFTGCSSPWSYTGLTEGSHTFSVKAIDALGNADPSPAVYTWLVDLTKPSVTAFSLPAYSKELIVAITTLTASDNESVIGYMVTESSGTPIADDTRWSATAPANYTFESTGAKILYAWAQDEAGNISTSMSRTVTVDSTTPLLTVSTLSDGSWTNNPVLNLTGLVSDNAGMESLTINDEPVTILEGGSFSWVLSLAEGENTIVLIAIDLAGNETTDLRTVFFDKTLPVITITSPADNSETNNANLELSGTVDENSTVTVRVNEESPLEIPMTGYTFNALGTLRYGVNTIEVTAVDWAGNPNTVKRSVIYDNQKPSLSITQPNQDIVTNESVITIKGVVSDLTGVTVIITKDEETFSPEPIEGVFEQTITLTEEKTYQIIIKATDEVGNTTTGQRNIIYDVTPPVLTINPVTSLANQSIQIITGTVEEGASVYVETGSSASDGSATMSGSLWNYIVTGLEEGANGLTVTAKDAAGNTTRISTVITLDQTVPNGAILIDNGATHTKNLEVTLTLWAEDISGIVEMKLSHDGKNWLPAESYASPRAWTLTPEDGVKTVYVRFRDAAGNWSSALSGLITLDTTSPKTTITNAPSDPSKSSPAVFSFTSTEAGSSFQCQLDSEPFESCTSPFFYSGLADGSHTFSVKATDAAGNPDEIPAGYTWTVDTIAPSGAITINGGASITGTTAVILALSATDANGVSQMEFSTDGINWTIPEVYSVSNAWTLASGDGLKTVYVRYQDPAGNRSEAFNAAISLDTTSPVVTAFLLPTYSKELTVTINTLTAIDFLGVTGYMVTESATAPAATEAGWSANVPAGYTFTTDGAKTLYAWAMDGAGNVSAGKSATVIIDLTAPIATITANPARLTNSTTESFGFTSSETGATFHCQLDGQSYEPCTSPKSYLALTEGNHTFNVKATDLAGNIGDPAIYTWAIDLAVPKVTTFSLPSYSKGLTVPVTSLTATDNLGVAGYLVTESYGVPGAAELQWAVNPPSSYTFANAGPKTLYAWAKDEAGNVSLGKSATVTIDMQAPALTVSTLSDGSWTNDPLLNVSGVVTDNSGLESLPINGQDVTIIHPGVVFSHALTLLEGENLITVTARDMAGNESTDTRAIMLDQSLPVLTITTPSDNSETKSQSIEISGTVDETSTVTLKVNVGDPEDIPVSDNGFSRMVELSYGLNTIEVTAVDLAGNASMVKRSVVYDDKGPSLAITQPIQDTVTNQSAIILAGEVSDLTGISITITKDANRYTPTLLEGKFEQTLTFTEEKSYHIVAIATDDVGNSTTVARNIIYDKRSPALTINPVTSPTNQPIQVITGTVEEGASVYVKTGSSASEGLATVTGSLWSYKITELVEGANSLSVTAEDRAGNTTQIAAYITLDITVPNGTIMINNGATHTGSEDVTLMLWAEDINNIVEMRLSHDGNNWLPAESYASPRAWSLTPGDGVKTVYVRFRDAAGNWSSVFTGTIILDTAAPDTKINGVPSDPSKSPTASLSFTSTEEAGASFQCQLDGGGYTECTSPVSYNSLTEGSHTFNVKSIDQAGNIDQTPAVYTWTIDTTPPETTIGNKPSTLTNSTSASFTFTSTETGYSFQCGLDGNGYIDCTSPMSYSDLSEGSHVFFVRAIDAAGNPDQSPAIYIWTVDLTGPTVTALSLPKYSNSLNVPIGTFAATDNIGVTGYIVTESEIAPGATDAGWSATAPASYSFIAAGAKLLYAWAKDAANNVSSSLSAPIIVDTTAPTVTAFFTPVNSNALTVAITTLTATDNVEVTDYMITESDIAPNVSDPKWSATAQASYTFATSGIKTLYAWAKDASGNVSESKSTSVNVDTTAPTVTAFSIPAASNSLVVTITAFTASDNAEGSGISGYMVTESLTGPSSQATDWSTTVPTSYPFATSGVKTLYAWAKDAAGNVSANLSATVNIQILHGDINADNVVDLKDVILALQVLSGSSPLGIRTDYGISGTDVDGDNKIGLTEVIYILQMVGGIRK